jgi:hypothetical protein
LEGVEALMAGPAAALATAYDFRRHRRVLEPRGRNRGLARGAPPALSHAGGHALRLAGRRGARPSAPGR